MKEWIKHAVDCSLAFGISFFSILGATGNITLKDTLIAVVPSLLVGLIKFRDYWNTKLDPLSKRIKTPTIFI